MQWCAGLYHMSVKMYTSDVLNDQSRFSSSCVITREFLLPVIEGIKVTQYGSEAAVVITGERLWFTHSLTMSTTLKPFQVQKESVSFCAKTTAIQVAINGQEKEITLFSYFAEPITKKIHVELDVS